MDPIKSKTDLFSDTKKRIETFFRGLFNLSAL